MYKQALKLKLRFQTSKGPLSVEQLMDLSRNQLVTVVRNLKKKIKTDSDDDLAFLDDSATQVNEIDQLRFNIAKDIYLTKKAAAEAIKEASEVKEHNQRILAKIQALREKKEDELSEEELLSKLR